MRYDRTVLAYHGCDASVAESILSGAPFKRSANDYDWLGEGVYFWEYGADRALQFAQEQVGRKGSRVSQPAVVGALVQLGNCFDLMDTRFTSDLQVAYESLRRVHSEQGWPLPVNAGATPDKKLRRLDCAVLNFYLQHLKETAGITYDSVRCGFVEGQPAFTGSGIALQTHIQLAVRSPACILGVFRPTMAE